MMADEWKIQIAEVGVLYFFLISAGTGWAVHRWAGGSDDVSDELWGIE